MKIVQINSVPNGSTGKIMMSIHNELLKQGHESYVVWGRGRKSQNNHEIYLNDKLGVYFHVIYSRLTGKTGFASKRSTKRLIKKLEKIKPDIIHLHNIHGYYINIDLLFNYIKNNNIKVIWTLHDCWAFTGQCPHFERLKCEKWKEQCYKCPLTSSYPKTFIDNSKWNYNKKKELFTGVDNLTIVTPSKWLAELAKQSFLKNYPIEVINNGIDTNVFKPTKSSFRKKYNLENKKIILGVSNVWTESKGYYDFIKLAKVLDENYKIVMVGLNDKQLKRVPNNIIGIKRIESQKELAELYTVADVFFNPSLEESFGMTNIEAISCGTPVIAYNSTATPEIVKNGLGIIIDTNFNEVELTIQKICSNFKDSNNTYKKNYPMDNMIINYINIYTK